MTRAPRALLVLALAVALGAGAFRSAEVGASTRGAEADSLDRFLGGLSDSTDDYFGISSAPIDTAGLDSALAYGLDHPNVQPRRKPFHFGVLPQFDFNRVDGPTYGGRVELGDRLLYGQIEGEVHYAVGPNDWLGGGGYRKTWKGRDVWWSGRVVGGRYTWSMDRDYYERHYASLRALTFGKDYKRYYDREGFGLQLERETRSTRTSFEFRDMIESPLFTTTTWNLAGKSLAVIDNLAASKGRAVEVGLEGTVLLPWVPVTAFAGYQQSLEGLGSNLDYRRLRVAMASEVGIGRAATLVTQASYGRLGRTAVPQAAFYLGGPHSLRSITAAELGGTGMALARVDLIGAHDILAVLHLPHPAILPIQIGAFGGIGAVWGVDPYGGPTRPGVEWPHREAWISEAGASLLYRPGLPNPNGFFRLNYSVPIGPNREHKAWSVSYTHAIDILKPIERD